jgi:hypothetical protein
MGEKSPGTRLVTLGVIGALVVGGVVDVKRIESQHACALDWAEGNHAAAIACAAGLRGLSPSLTPSASGQIDGIKLASQKIVDPDLKVTFGEVSMQMAGTGTFNYSEIHIPGIALNKLYYNQGNKKTTEVRAVPCFNFGNYNTAFDPSANPGANVDTSHVSVTMTPSVTGKSISSVDIDTGNLDYCWPHIPLTNTNDNMISARGWSVGYLPENVRSYYQTEMEKLLIDGAISMSSPQCLLKMNKVDAAVEVIAEGELVHQYPQDAQAISNAFAGNSNRVHVHTPPVSEREAAYAATFQHDLTDFKNNVGAPKGVRMSNNTTIDAISPVSCNLSGAIPTGSSS